jgi:AcrR family transcriptional regulator
VRRTGTAGARARRRTTQARGLITRAKLLRAAEELLPRLGYDGTAISDIAERAGVSVGTLYHHFPDKRALLLELIDSWGERESEARASEPDLERFLGEDPRRAIGLFLRRGYERLRKEPSLYLVVLALADRDAEVQRRYRRISQLAIERWRALLDYGQRRGLFRADVHPASAALLIHHAIDMAATQVLVRDLVDPEPEHVLRELTNMICRYVLEEPS